MVKPHLHLKMSYKMLMQLLTIGSACELAGQGGKPLAVAVLLCELGTTEQYST